MYRIGQGYDIHKLVLGRRLIIGGIEIEYEKGLQGHSDADVLVHSIIDSMLGALALGDIGVHFPDNNSKYKNINSLILLQNAYKIVKEKGYIINNLDNTIIAQEPKMNPFIPLMTEKLAQTLGIDKKLISIKAKTMEEQDSIGQKKAIAAQSIILLRKAAENEN